MTKKFTLLLVAVLFCGYSFAQQANNGTYIDGRNAPNTISTAVSFLTIAPDTRAGGLGDCGVATTPDGNSQHWNPAKYIFIDTDYGVSISYTPWLHQLVSDMNLAYLSGYYKFNSQNAIAASLLYFDLGSITFKDWTGSTLMDFRPREFSLDLSYSRLFAKGFSGAVAMRFIYSNLTGGQDVGNGVTSKAGTSVAADVAFYYKNDDIMTGNLKSSVMWGLNISNLGNKISYTSNENRDFIPANFRTGVGYMLSFDEHNDLLFTADFNKLLVPSSPTYYQPGEVLPNGDTVISGSQEIKYGKDPNISMAAALFTSWWDAPGDATPFVHNGKPSRFREELAEITFAVGVEYCYSKQFAVRLGYFHEHAYKGNRKFVTVGAGLRLNVFGLDFAYLIPTTQQNPLQNTLRFTLTFDFGGLAKEQRDAKKADKEARNAGI
ncbi:MAG: type IX secretion system outer membrane channel protein PorV [Bacteroidales bacterium]|nr:type IX secretion system outer membrane channel protein PorV [Bacteroidales bacterium]